MNVSMLLLVMRPELLESKTSLSHGQVTSDNAMFFTEALNGMIAATEFDQWIVSM
jgi:hypothetical protein